MSDMVGGFSIPSYQRPYRWGPSDMSRLCDDIIAGLDRLRHDASAVTFIGAIITVSGVGGDHVTLPPDPRQIIDGQQRLTTILMIAIAADERLRSLGARVRSSPEVGAHAQAWFEEQIAEVRGQLSSCLAAKKNFGDDGFRELPKLTRDITDRWSNRNASARYLSPIANLIHSYLRWGQQSAEFAATMPNIAVQPESPGSSPADFDSFHYAFERIRRLVGDVAKGAEGELMESIDLTNALDPASHTVPVLFPTAEDVLVPALRPLVESSIDVAKATRLLLFTRFLLERVALTQINAKDEAYAFDLFDSLNTTGEPLTAFETFVPLVVQAEGADSYRTSPSFEHVSLSSRLIASDRANVQRNTERLVTTFLLADAGLKGPYAVNLGSVGV